MPETVRSDPFEGARRVRRYEPNTPSQRLDWGSKATQEKRMEKAKAKRQRRAARAGHIIDAVVVKPSTPTFDWE